MFKMIHNNVEFFALIAAPQINPIEIPQIPTE